MLLVCDTGFRLFSLARQVFCCKFPIDFYSAIEQLLAYELYIPFKTTAVVAVVLFDIIMEMTFNL